MTYAQMYSSFHGRLNPLFRHTLPTDHRRRFLSLGPAPSPHCRVLSNWAIIFKSIRIDYKKITCITASILAAEDNLLSGLCMRGRSTKEKKFIFVNTVRYTVKNIGCNRKQCKNTNGDNRRLDALTLRSHYKLKLSQ